MDGRDPPGEGSEKDVGEEFLELEKVRQVHELAERGRRVVEDLRGRIATLQAIGASACEAEKALEEFKVTLSSLEHCLHRAQAETKQKT